MAVKHKTRIEKLEEQYPQVPEFLKNFQIQFSAIQIQPDRNFNGGRCGTFRVELTINGKTHTGNYSMGEGHKIKPTCKEQSFYGYGSNVEGKYPSPWIGHYLQSLFTDASCFEQSENMDDFAANYCSENMKPSKVLAMFNECGQTLAYLTSAFGSKYSEAQEIFGGI